MFIFLLEKIHRAGEVIAGFICNTGFLFMAALVWLLSAWRVILPAAGALAFVFWIWALAGAGAAIVGALVCILAGALMWLAHTFRI